jgi:serine/threonine-protein kinase
LRDRIVSGNRFTLKDTVCFLEQGLIFIQQLEKKRIVYRDIKPENIMISEQGKVYFLDFGIARILGVPFLDARAKSLHQTPAEFVTRLIRKDMAAVI